MFKPTNAVGVSEAGETSDNSTNLVRNLFAGGASSIVKALLQLGMLPVMGRLLGPKEFGLYATVLPIVAFFTVIADGGLGASLAREKSPDKTVWTTAFYVMLAVGICLAGAVNLCGFALASVMHEPRLFGLMALLSVSFVFIAASTLPAARMFQRNDLVSLSAVDTFATFLGAGLGVVFAVRGFGALSLAIQTVAAYAVRAVGFNVLAFEMPGRRFSLRALADHLNTGGVLVSSRLIDMFCRFAENAMFSLAFGPAMLGTYTFANQVCRFLCESASNPIWSATYAQSLNLSARRISALIGQMMRLMLLATFPVACILAVSAPSVLPVLLGAKWQAAGGFLQILICAYSISATATVGSAALLATGANKLFLFTGALLSVGRVLAVAAGPWIGSIDAVIAVALVQLVYAAFMSIAVDRSYFLDKLQLLRSSSPTLMSSMAGAFACLATHYALPASSSGTVASLLVGGSTFLAALITTDKDLNLTNLRRSLDRVRGRV